MTLKWTGLMPGETIHSQQRSGVPRRSGRGFALVITLSLMILITVIAVGLLTLSSVSLRSSTQSQAQATARANARLALALAIGELQRQTGSFSGPWRSYNRLRGHVPWPNDAAHQSDHP